MNENTPIDTVIKQTRTERVSERGERAKDTCHLRKGRKPNSIIKYILFHRHCVSKGRGKRQIHTHTQRETMTDKERQ